MPHYLHHRLTDLIVVVVTVTRACTFSPSGLGRRGDCRVPPEGVRGRSVSVPVDASCSRQNFTICHATAMQSLRPLKPQSDGRGSRLSLCACVYAALSQHQSVPLPAERCLKAVPHCTDTATCFTTSPPLLLLLLPPRAHPGNPRRSQVSSASLHGPGGSFAVVLAFVCPEHM